MLTVIMLCVNTGVSVEVLAWPDAVDPRAQEPEKVDPVDAVGRLRGRGERREEEAEGHDDLSRAA